MAGALYVVEFFADKIPWVDTAWDALHTFIRPLGAAWIGAAAGTGVSLSPEQCEVSWRRAEPEES